MREVQKERIDFIGIVGIVLTVISIVVTCISIVVTLISIHHDKNDKNKRSNRRDQT